MSPPVPSAGEGRSAPHPEVPAGPGLELIGLQHRFGRTQVLRGVDLAVRPGERVAIIGPNGAGKSTLFDLVSGRLTPTSGRIQLQGRRIDGLAPQRIHRLGLARSFQISSLFGRLSAFENLRCAVLWTLGHRYAFWKPVGRLAEANRRAEEMLARIGLQAEREVPARALGYAQQRALEFGVTLVGGAGMVLLDEPTAGMSRSETRAFVPRIRALTEGRTLLVVEHDMSVVFDLADRIAVLVHGQVLAFDTPAAVRANPAVQAAYLGATPWATAEAQAPC